MSDPNDLHGVADLGEEVDPRELRVPVVDRDRIDYLDMLPKRRMCPDSPKCLNASRRIVDVDSLKDARGALLIPVSAHQSA